MIKIQDKNIEYLIIVTVQAGKPAFHPYEGNILGAAGKKSIFSGILLLDNSIVDTLKNEWTKDINNW